MLLSASKIELKIFDNNLRDFTNNHDFRIYEISEIIMIFKQLYQPIATDMGE